MQVGNKRLFWFVVVATFVSSMVSISFGLRAADKKQQSISDVSADTAAARKDFDAAVAEAKANYDKKMTAATTGYIKKLEAAMTAETKRGNIDGAVLIRDEIKARKEGDGAVTGGAQAAPSGTWHVRMTTGYQCDYAFAGDNVQVSPPGERTKLKRVGTDLIAQWSNGNTDRFTFVNDRMILEYWDKGKDPAKEVATGMGVGTSKTGHR